MLMRVMLGLQQPSQGSIKVFGCPLTGCSSGDLERLRNRWGVLFQQGALFSALNVFEECGAASARVEDATKDIVRELVMTKLKLVGIDSDSVASGRQNYPAA